MIARLFPGRFLIGCMGLFVAALCVGCGGKGDVSGTVSYNGKTLKGGYVIFEGEGEGGGTYSAMIMPDGKYTVTGVKSGTYKVCVETESLKGAPPSGGNMPMQRSGGGPRNMQPKNAPLSETDKNYKAPPSDMMASTGYNPSGAPAAIQKENLEKYVQIPPMYAKKDSTPLEFSVSGGSQEFPIELK